MSIRTVDDELNLTAYEQNPFIIDDQTFDENRNNQSLVGISSPQKKARAG